jgi:hypothetical protein
MECEVNMSFSSLKLQFQLVWSIQIHEMIISELYCTRTIMSMVDRYQLMYLVMHIRFDMNIGFIRSQFSPLRHSFNIRLSQCGFLRWNIHLARSWAMTAIYLIFRDMIIWLLSLQLIHLLIIFATCIRHHHHLVDWIIDQMIDVALGLRDYRKWRAYSSSCYQSILSVGSIVTLPLILNKMLFWLLERKDLIWRSHSWTMNRKAFSNNLSI